MILRPYQQKWLEDIREELSWNIRHVCAQLPTGAGKTVAFSSITQLAQEIGNSVWIVVPRNHLVDQCSSHLSKIGVKHSRITAGRQESRAFNVHVCSLQTLMRRINSDSIKSWPKIVIFDECHTNLDNQIQVCKAAPPDTIFIGVTATPERFDTMGLSEMYEIMISGPAIKELVELDYLVPVRYFRPPSIDLSEIKRVGTEYDAAQLKALFERKAIFGDVIDHYLEIAKGRTALIFTRSVELSDRTAEAFQARGIHIESIHGKTPKKKQIELLRMAREGEIAGLSTCDLLTYGIDITNISCIIHLRPTESVALYYQINGRGLRVHPGKEDCIILDHVGNIDRHGHPLTEREWNFNGKEKRKIDKRPSVDVLRLCPNCWLYYDGDQCPRCSFKRDASRKDLVEVDGRLEEVRAVPLQARPPEEKREISDRIAILTDNFQNSPEIDNGIVAEMLEIAGNIDRQPMWVYHQLNKFGYIVNMPLLYAIQRVKGYKRGWPYMQKLELEKRR